MSFEVLFIFFSFIFFGNAYQYGAFIQKNMHHDGDGEGETDRDRDREYGCRVYDLNNPSSPGHM